MCGRFADPNLANIGFEALRIRVDPLPRRFNVKPTQEVYVMLEGTLVFARWGLIPSWHRGDLTDWRASTFNARLEEVAEKPAFRGPWRTSRCLIPAGGYFEWTGEKAPR